MSDLEELRKVVAHGMSIPSGLAGRLIDALEAKDKRIVELEADVARLREQRDSLQAKVHLCTAYDYLEKRCAELESAAKWVCRDATHHEEGDCCLVKVDALEALEQALNEQHDE